MDSQLKWDIHTISIQLSDLFAEMAVTDRYKDREELLNKSAVLLTYLDVFVYGLSRGWKQFNWEEAERLGWFSRADYDRLPELKGFKVPG